MKIKKVDIKEFKKNIYPHYKKLYPFLERKFYWELKKTYKKHITDFIEIFDNELFVGFIIVNHLNNTPLLQLEYLGILSEFQNKGYGTEAIKLVNELYKSEYEEMFIEIEKLGNGKDKKENDIREKRANFYVKNGFIDKNLDIVIDNVNYSIYTQCFNDNALNINDIKKYVLKIYAPCFGKKNVNRRCKFI